MKTLQSKYSFALAYSEGDSFVHCFVTAVLRNILYLSYRSEGVVRLSNQMSSKSPPLTLLPRSATGTNNNCNV